MIKLKHKEDCCGCTACKNICRHNAIEMKEDNEGFLYPFINSNACINCGLCEKVCPSLNSDEEKKPLNTYAAKNPNEDIRMKSSSGGIFSMLAEYVINKKGIVFGAKFDKKWEVVHGHTETIDGLAAFRGSKYVQSQLGNTFQDVELFLKNDRLVLFTGTPCQIAGLKLFLKKDYNNLIAIDFVCHGVPSYKVFLSYLQEKIKDGNFVSKQNIEFIEFKNKNLGWHLSSLAIGAKNNTSYVASLNEDPYMKGFLHDLYLRPSCYSCNSKAFKSNSDITIADYWGIENVLPDFDDNKGISLVMLTSLTGKNLFECIAPDFIETSYEDALKGNPCIEKSFKKPAKRNTFFSQFNRGIPFSVIINNLTKENPLRKFNRQTKRVIKLIISKVP